MFPRRTPYSDTNRSFLQLSHLPLGHVRFKRTHIDKQLNKLVLSIFVILFCMCTIAAIFSANWERKQGNVSGASRSKPCLI